VELLASSVEYIQVPFEGPYPDLTIYPCAIALIPDNGTEPGPGDWVAAEWLPNATGVPEISVLQNRWPAGLYMAFGQVAAGAETVRKRSGRVRIGDTRT
jgi:hypothetical protein